VVTVGENTARSYPGSFCIHCGLQCHSAVSHGVSAISQRTAYCVVDTYPVVSRFSAHAQVASTFRDVNTFTVCQYFLTGLHIHIPGHTHRT
jgi:hypothetical protein